jgi:hypothetical protein
MFGTWANEAWCFSAEADDQLTEAQAMLDRLNGQLDALLGAFEPESVAAVEGLPERLEASCGRLEGFVKGVARDALQYTMGLVKSHSPEADLDSVGDSVPPDYSDENWEANHTSVHGIAERIVADLNL